LPPLLAGADKVVRSANVCGWHFSDVAARVDDVSSLG
jgi:hypothetical protein